MLSRAAQASVYMDIIYQPMYLELKETPWSFFPFLFVLFFFSFLLWFLTFE